MSNQSVAVARHASAAIATRMILITPPVFFENDQRCLQEGNW